MIRYKKLYLDSPDLIRPADGDAGYDLRAYGEYDLYYDSPLSINTGVAIEIPAGYVGLVFPRSGLRFNSHITNYGTGVIDASYRGEMKVLLWRLHFPSNSFREAYTIQHGDKIAQLVIVPCFTDDVEEVSDLSETNRGSKGFGSTGR